MANIVDGNIIGESDGAVTIAYYLQSDGAAGELVNQPVLAASECSPPLGAGQYLSLYEIWYQANGCSLTFAWKTLQGAVPFWILSPGVDSRHKFHRFGGLIDDSGMYAQGQLMMSTNGFVQTGANLCFVIRMRKHSGQTPVYKAIGQPQGQLPLETNLLNS